MSLDTQEFSMKDVSEWTEGKIFGKYKGHRRLNNGINILSHTGGFAVFFPPSIFYEFDIQVPIRLGSNKKECWIAGKGFGFVKIDVTLEQVDDKECLNYVANDVNVALDKIEQFVKKNFVNTSELYPDSNYFTHGSYIENSDMPRPFRFRMGGNYRIRF